MRRIPIFALVLTLTGACTNTPEDDRDHTVKNVQLVPQFAALNPGATIDLSFYIAAAFDREGRFVVSGGTLGPVDSNRGSVTYTAPLTPGLFRVRYESTTDKTKYGECVVLVQGAAGKPGLPHPQWLQGQHEKPVLAMDWSADGKTLVTLGEESTLRWWNTSDGSVQRVREIAGGNDLEVSPDGKFIVLANGNDVLQLDATTGAEMRVFQVGLELHDPGQNDFGRVTFVDVEPDNRHVLVAYFRDENDGFGNKKGHHIAARLDLQGAPGKTATQIFDDVNGDLDPPSAISRHPSGTEIALSTSYGTLVITRTGLKKHLFAGGGARHYMHNGEWLGAGGAAIDSQTGDPVPEADLAAVGPLERFGPHFRTSWTAIDPTGKQRARVDFDLKSVGRFVVLTEGEFGNRRNLQGPAELGAVSWSPDGKLVAALGDGGPLHQTEYLIWVFDAATGAVLQKLKNENGHPPVFATFSPDSRLLLTYGGTTGLQVFDTTTWQSSPVVLPAEVGVPSTAAWVTTHSPLASGMAPVNEQLAVGSGAPTKVLEWPSGKVLRKLNAACTSGMVWNDVGDRFVCANPSACNLYDGTDGHHLAGWLAGCDWGGGGATLTIWNNDGTAVWVDKNGVELKRVRSEVPGGRVVAMYPKTSSAVAIGDEGVVPIDFVQPPTARVPLRRAGLGTQSRPATGAWDWKGERLAVAGFSFVAVWKPEDWDPKVSADVPWASPPLLEDVPDACSRPVVDQLPVQLHIVNRTTETLRLYRLDPHDTLLIKNAGYDPTCIESENATIAPGKGVLQPTQLFHVWRLRGEGGAIRRTVQAVSGTVVDVVVP